MAQQAKKKKGATPAPVAPPPPKEAQDFDALMALVEKDAKNKSRFYRASKAADGWRYIDFNDLAKKRPCLPLEWLYGTRGFLVGRVIKYSSNEAAGKSSVMLMNVGMAQAAGGVWPCIWETEKVLPPPDYVYSLGCNPDNLLLKAPNTIDECLKDIPEFIKAMRTDVDKEKKYPIFIGIDSVSGLGIDALDIAEGSEKSKQSLGYHARQFSKFFREKFKLCEREDAVLFATAQIKANIETGGMPGMRPRGGGKKTSSIAEAPFAYHASWIIKLYHKQATAQDGRVLGELITMFTEKNKLAPHNRLINVLMRKPEELPAGEAVWDFTQATADLLFGPFCPFADGEASRGGGWYRHVALGDTSYRLDDFLDAFYANEELLMQVREKFRIRGFGFKFEADYDAKGEVDAATP